MESSQSNKRPHSGDGNDAGGKRGKFSGRGRGGGSSFRGYAGGGGDGQSGQGFRGGRGFGGDSGFKGGRGGFRGGEGGRFGGGRGGNSDGFRGGQSGFRGRGGGGFRGGRGGDNNGFRGGQGGEGGGFRGGRGREGGEFRGGRGGEGGEFRGGRGGEGGEFRRGQGGFEGRGTGFGGGRGGQKREGVNSAVMNHGSDLKFGQKLYAEFPDWNTDLIHKALAAIYFDGQHNTNWHKVSENIRNSLPPDEIEKLWNNLIAKLEPPTFQCALDSIKMLLKRTVILEKLPELDGVPRTFESLGSYTNKEYFRKFPEELHSNKSIQARKIFSRLTPTERLPFFVAWKRKRNEYDLLWFNYLKEHSGEFQEWSDLTTLNNSTILIK